MGRQGGQHSKLLGRAPPDAVVQLPHHRPHPAPLLQCRPRCVASVLIGPVESERAVGVGRLRPALDDVRSSHRLEVVVGFNTDTTLDAYALPKDWNHQALVRHDKGSRLVRGPMLIGRRSVEFAQLV